MKRLRTLTAAFVRAVSESERNGDRRGGHGLSLFVRPPRNGRWSKTESQRYSAPKMWIQIYREGYRVVRCSVERLTLDLDLFGTIRCKLRRTTVADPTVQRPRDLALRCLLPAGPIPLYAADLIHMHSESPATVSSPATLARDAIRVILCRTRTPPTEGVMGNDVATDNRS